MQERLNRLYEQYGYRKFKMSRFEDYDLYAQNRDFLRQDRIITFTDADGALKALKPDITLSIMKSNGGDSEKVYYNENVCREVGGAFREILQVGVESVGQIDPYAEAEVIALAARSLEQLSPKYVLALSDVSFVGSLLDQMGLSAPVRGKVLGLIARKNVPGLCVLAGSRPTACGSWWSCTPLSRRGLAGWGGWPRVTPPGRPCGSSPSQPDCWSRLGWRSGCGWISPW